MDMVEEASSDEVSDFDVEVLREEVVDWRSGYEFTEAAEADEADHDYRQELP